MKLPVLQILCFLCLLTGARAQLLLNFNNASDFTSHFTSQGGSPYFVPGGGIAGTGAVNFSGLSGISVQTLSSQTLAMRGSYEIGLRFKYIGGSGATLSLGLFSDNESTPGYQPTGQDPGQYVQLGNSNSLLLASQFSFQNSASFFPALSNGQWYQLVYQSIYQGTTSGVIDHFSIAAGIFTADDQFRENPLGVVTYNLQSVQYQSNLFGHAFIYTSNASNIIGEVDGFYLIPEPSTWTLLALGGVLTAIVYLRRRSGSLDPARA